MKHNLRDLKKTGGPRGRLSEGTFCFSVLTALCLILMFVLFFVTNGGFISSVFFWDPTDTGMDFFNSLAETNRGTPYTVYKTLYPPLANLFFYILKRCVPYEVAHRWARTHEGVISMRGTKLDLRVNQAPMLLFIFYVLFTIVLLMAVIEAVMNKETKFLKGFSAACCFCYGNIYAIERGNIILLSMVFAMIFVFFRNSENGLVRELALISLAVSAGLKLYPAVLGIMLLKDKQWKRAVRTVIYGVLAFLPPFWCFEGVSALKLFFRTLFTFSEKGEAALGGYGLSGIFNIGFEIFKRVTGVPFPFQPAVSALLKGAVLLALLFVICRTSIQWTALLALTLILVFAQNAGEYTLTYFLIPFIAFVKENPQIDRKNALPYLFFFAVLLPFPTPMITPWHNLREAVVIMLLLTATACMVIESVPLPDRRGAR